MCQFWKKSAVSCNNIYNIGPKRDVVRGEWGNYMMRNLMLGTAHPILCE